MSSGGDELGRAMSMPPPLSLSLQKNTHHPSLTPPLLRGLQFPPRTFLVFLFVRENPSLLPTQRLAHAHFVTLFRIFFALTARATLHRYDQHPHKVATMLSRNFPEAQI